MEDIILKSPIGAGIAGAAAIAVAWKVLWPLISSFVTNQTTTSRTESGTLTQLSNVLKDAIERAENERQLRIKAENERDELFTRLTQLEAKMQIVQAKLEAYEKNGTLTAYNEDMSHGKDN